MPKKRVISDDMKPILSCLNLQYTEAGMGCIDADGSLSFMTSYEGHGSFSPLKKINSK